MAGAARGGLATVCLPDAEDAAGRWKVEVKLWKRWVGMRGLVFPFDVLGFRFSFKCWRKEVVVMLGSRS